MRTANPKFVWGFRDDGNQTCMIPPVNANSSFLGYPSIKRNYLMKQLREYCDEIHEKCLQKRDEDTKMLEVCEREVGYYTRKFLVKKTHQLLAENESDSQRIRVDLLQLFFLWRGIALFQLPIAQNEDVAILRDSSEQPISGLLLQLLDDMLPSTIDPRITAARTFIGDVNVLYDENLFTLLASGRNTDIDIFCDKLSQVSLSDSMHLSRRLVYLLRCRPQLRLQDWYVYFASLSSQRAPGVSLLNVFIICAGNGLTRDNI